MKKSCILTGEMFDTNDESQNISPNTMKSVVKELGRNIPFRSEVMSAMVQDQECKNVMAKAILNCTAESVGLPAPGTIAEFFCRLWKDRYTTKTRKTHKKT